MPAFSSQRSCGLDGPVAAIKRQCAADHIGYGDAVQRLTFSHAGRQQYRERDFVQLQALPIGRTAEPLVLVPAAIRLLRGNQIAQRVARLLASAPKASNAVAHCTRSRGQTR